MRALLRAIACRPQPYNLKPLTLNPDTSTLNPEPGRRGAAQWIGSHQKEKGGDDGRRGEEGQNEDSMGPTAELIRISFSAPSGFEAGVGLMWV